MTLPKETEGITRRRKSINFMPKFNQYEVAVSSFNNVWNNVEFFDLAFIIPLKRMKKILRAFPQPVEWVRRPVSVVYLAGRPYTMPATSNIT